jgi:hypothetical protein
VQDSVPTQKEDRTVFLLVELKPEILDYGIPGISPIHMLLLFAMMLAIPMIPYAFLYRAVRDKKKPAAARSLQSSPFAKLAAWIYLHRHPQLLHHH